MTAICLKFQYGFLCAGVSEVSWMGVWFFFSSLHKMVGVQAFETSFDFSTLWQ